jgi:D-lactate dehydrogenase
MWRIKKLFDPRGLLAPGVMLNKDPVGHLKNTHTYPEIESVANACIECGYCEPVCPSRHLTTTPRQRIALRREMLRHEPGSPIQNALLKEYEYDAVQTCAGDGSCEHACPVQINTGVMMKHFRHSEHGRRREWVAERIAASWGMVEPIARMSLFAGIMAAKLLGDRAIHAPLSAASALVSPELLPSWVESLPMPARSRLPRTKEEGAVGIYFPACINRIFGGSKKVVDYLTPENRSRHKHLTIYDSVTWADEKLLPNLDVKHKARSATVHPTCSTHTLGVDVTLRRIAGQLAERPFYPLPADEHMLRVCR